MVKKLTKHGNSLALVIDKPILDLLGITADTPLEVTTDGTGLHVLPAQDEAQAKKFQKAREKVHRKYGQVFKKLAE